MSERKLRNPFDGRNERFASCPGNRFRDKMCVVRSERGGKHLEKVGEQDIVEMIQSYRDSCDLQKILERCMATGDVSALQRVQGVYADLTGYPCDPRIAHDLLLKSKLVYEGLSTKQKAMYPTFDDFMETFANDENISKFLETLKPSVEDTVSASEGSVTNES